MTFQKQYEQALHRQAQRQNRELSPINLAVAQLISNTADKAIRDTRMGSLKSPFKVVSAPTGSAKTNSAIAFACAMYAHDPAYTCAFVVEEISHAQEIYIALAHEIPDKDLGIWTSFHDVSQRNPSVIERLGIPVTLTTLESTASKRVVIYTHKKWLNEIEHWKDYGVRRHQGKPRDVLFIDEQPSVTQIIERTPADILKLRDIILSVDTHHHLVSILTTVAHRMEAVFSTNGDEMQGVRLVECLEAYDSFTEAEAHTFCSTYGIRNPEQFIEGFRFLRACSMGYCFLTRGAPRSFVAYVPSFSPEPNQVILDATADLCGLYPLLGGKLAEGVPKIDYSNLRLNHVEPPKEFSHLRSVVSNRKTAEDYAAWIRGVVMQNTKAGDRVLVIVHKDMVTTHGLFPHTPREPDSEVFPGRVCSILWWGQGIGSNQYKDCTEVFMFSEFYQPRRAIVAKTLGAKSQSVEESDIHTLRGKLKGDYLSIQEGDLLRWTKQLASRGNVRNVDTQGKCGAMNLYTSMDFNRLIANLDRLFPNAQSPSRYLEYVVSSDPKGSLKGREGLIALLSTSASSHISFKDVQAMTDIKSCEVRRELGSPTVKPSVDAYGWTVVNAKSLGKSGKGLWLVRKM
ncbi:MAG TPA: hypothetical protein VLA04_03780 [Verrucomicrobiae bacterium]|nr:hypothetical protein [Verrucomicrobiae bacterium]